MKLRHLDSCLSAASQTSRQKDKGMTYSETFGNECYLTINWRNIPHEYRLSNAQTIDSFIIEVDNVNSSVLTSQELCQILHNYYRCTVHPKSKPKMFESILD